MLQMSTFDRKVEELREKGAIVNLGHGPLHPHEPAPQLTNQIDDYFVRYPFLQKDLTYVEFINTYAGLYFHQPNTDVSLNIFGFSDASFRLVRLDGDYFLEGETNILENGFLVFCDADLCKQEAIPARYKTLENTIGTGFAFDATGYRKRGVYRAKNVLETDEVELYWYCASFSVWLEAMIESNGNLPEFL